MRAAYANQAKSARSTQDQQQQQKQSVEQQKQSVEQQIQRVEQQFKWMRNKSTKQRKIVDHFESSTFTEFKDAARAKPSRVEPNWAHFLRFV